ncbi:Ulp1 protease family, C-terminal catalytic domain [Nesidiocoris tenuis]|uniref:Ulp1 protease family, C-terminal catalytic domain n=1 Tax=Nesidiocoris tenuis TaxID=355587 RepID=A0ABN7AL90_9HEMI|nr:Ulp1 protease family, C-terminal catalytic domain [Nesidiocoris tenuis]
MERVIPVVIDGNPTLISEAQLRDYCALENIPYDSPPHSTEPTRTETEPAQLQVPGSQDQKFPSSLKDSSAAKNPIYPPPLTPLKLAQAQPVVVNRQITPTFLLNPLPSTVLSAGDLIRVPLSKGGGPSSGVNAIYIAETGQPKIRASGNRKINVITMEQSAVTQLSMNQSLDPLSDIEEELEEFIIFHNGKMFRFVVPLRSSAYNNSAELRDQIISHVIRHLHISQPSFISNVAEEPEDVPLFDKSEPKDILVDDPLASKEFLKYQADWERVMDMEAKEFKETCDIPGSRNATQQQLAVKVSEPMEIDSPSNGTNASKNETALSATVHLPVAQPQQPTTYIVTTPRPMATQFIPAPLVVTQISSPGVAQIVVSQPVVTQPVVSTPMNPIWVLPNVESSVNSKEPVKPLVSANSSAQAKEEKPVMQLIEVSYAFCETCGHNSKDLKTCQKCRRSLPIDAKITTMRVPAQQPATPAANAQAKDGFNATESECKFVMTLKCTSCGKNSIHKKICLYCKSPIPPNATAQYFKLRTTTAHLESKELKTDGTKKRKCQRKKKSTDKAEAIVSVDLTEDDEEHNSEKAADEKEASSSPLLPGLDKEPEINEDTVSPFHERISGGGVDFDEAINSKDVERATILCRTVRIGSYKTVPEGKVIITPFGITMKVPHIETREMVDVVIHRYEIIKILANFGKQIPLMFYYTTPACAQKIRKLIGMSNEEPRSAPFYYYNPASKVEPYRRITLLPEKVGEEPRLFILSTYDEQCLIEVLTDPEANNILVTAHPNAVDAAVEASQPAIQSRPISTTPARPSSVSTPTAQQTPQQQTQQQLMLLQQQQSSGLSVIQTILVYPPPPAKGGMPINNEDYGCLKEDNFLNDVIIDFYLRYFIENHLTADERRRMHLLSSFFYKRMTTKEPLKPDDNRSPAERRHDRVRKWIKNVDLFSKDFIVIPINESSHWFLGVICFPGLTGAVRISDGRPVPNPSNRRAALPQMIGGTTITRVLDPPPIVLDPEEERDEADADDEDLEPNSDEDEFEEPPEAGEELLDDATHPQPKVKAPKEPQDPIKQPCILIFDSLIGGSRAKVCATLREFMQIEYNVKHRATKGRRDFTADSFRASVVKVPQQTNFTDCGLYLLQFAETFFQKPIRDYRMPIKELVNWFDVEVVNRKRFEIQQLLHKLMDEQKVDVARLNLPDLELNPEGTSGGPRFMDGDDEMVGMGVNEMGDEGDISGDMDMMDADYEELEEEEEDEEMMDDELAEEDLRRYMLNSSVGSHVGRSVSAAAHGPPTPAQSEDLRNRLVRKEPMIISSPPSVPSPSAGSVSISSSVSITPAKSSAVTFASPAKPPSVTPSVAKPLNQISLTRKVLASSGVDITPTRPSKAGDAVSITPSPVANAKRKIAAQQPPLVKAVTNRLQHVPLSSAVVSRLTGVKKVRPDSAEISSTSSSSSHGSSKDKQ